MSRFLSCRTFATITVLYLVFSFAVYLSAAFTVAAGIVYLFVVAPFYLGCIAYISSLARQKNRSKLTFDLLPFRLSLLSQIGLMLTSPADCRGFKQGSACYSFVQTHWPNQDFVDSIHWGWVELLFPVLLIFHIVCILYFLRSIRFRST
jgi:hypothetical protein